jgi:hypothetical protein
MERRLSSNRTENSLNTESSPSKMVNDDRQNSETRPGSITAQFECETARSNEEPGTEAAGPANACGHVNCGSVSKALNKPSHVSDAHKRLGRREVLLRAKSVNHAIIALEVRVLIRLNRTQTLNRQDRRVFTADNRPPIPKRRQPKVKTPPSFRSVH